MSQKIPCPIKKRQQLISEATKYLADSCPKKRMLGVIVLGDIGDDEHVPLLKKMLNDPVEQVAMASAFTFGWTQGERRLQAFRLFFEELSAKEKKQFSFVERMIEDAR